jgi:acyl-CoA dehydrogenase
VNDDIAMLRGTLDSIFARHCDRKTRVDAEQSFPQLLWDVLADAGMNGLYATGEAGLAEVIALASAVGRHAAPVPIVEAAGLADWLVTSCGIALDAGLFTSAAGHADDRLALERRAGAWSARGALHRVPWGAVADRVIAIATTTSGPAVVALPKAASVATGWNLASEPRDTLHYDDVAVPDDAVAPTEFHTEALLLRGALLRSASMAGAMQRAFEMTRDYAQEREQFGRPVASHQAVQQHLALMAQEAACATMAVEAAVAGGEVPDPLAVATAKATAGRAAAVVTARAHQVHGAIGVTHEYDLHWLTRRLWAWQDEFRPARYWASRIGAVALARGPEKLWATISRTTSEHLPLRPVSCRV